MSNVLLTGGRAPATLDLARAFHAAGHRVVVAESAKPHLTGYSRVVARNYEVPPPRQDHHGFARALADIVERESIDLLVPTCEETYYVARARDALPARCRVFTETLETLHALHNKWTFINKARAFGLVVPETRLLSSSEDVRAAFETGERWVFKPAYSRFATKALICPPTLAALEGVTPSPAAPWVAQRFLPGRQVCSYSVAHGGVLTAHTAYPTEFTAGQGATIAFRPIEHEGVFAWVKAFVSACRFTGQIAFDFIESQDGSVSAIECNPRATSGVHLLASDRRLASAFLEPTAPLLAPPKEARAMTAAAMVVYSLPHLTSVRALRRWADVFVTSRDVIFRTDDPLPSLFQLVPFFDLVVQGWKKGKSALEMSTFDIEWNGES